MVHSTGNRTQRAVHSPVRCEKDCSYGWEHRDSRWRLMENRCGRTDALSRALGISVGGSGTDDCRGRGCGARRSRGCRSDTSSGSDVHTTQSGFSHHCHHNVHRHGPLRLCRNGVVSEPGPQLASNFGLVGDCVVCAVRIIGDFTHHGWRLARGFRSHDDARGRVGDLCNAFALARDHDAPTQDAGF